MNLLIHDYGGYAFTLQLAKELANRGHHVNYTYSVTTQLVQRLDPAGWNGKLNVHGVTLARPFQKYSFRQRRAAEIEHGRRVAAAILEQRPEVILSANAPLDAQAEIWKAGRKIGARLVYWFQDAIGLATRQLLRGRLPVIGEGVGLYYQALERRLARRSDHLTLISEDFLPLMDRWDIDGARITTIANWAPLEEIPVMPKDNPWARRHGLADQIVFLYAGILGLKHDPARLIELAQTADGQAQVVVVSEGGRAEWLAQRAAELRLNNLRLLPFQPKEELPQMFAAADVLVSILSEDAGVFSVPSKVLSYLCAQRPLLLSMPEENQAARLVRHSNAGVVVSPGDHETWAKAVCSLTQDEPLRLQMGASARDYAESHFDIHEIAEEFIEVLLPERRQFV